MATRLSVKLGDITQLAVDAIVNAANSSLLGGGGVDGAIHRAAGPELTQYCATLRGCCTGEAKASPGFELVASTVIHTVGPVWQGGNHHEAELLADCYRNSLLLTQQYPIKSIALPAISTGVYGYPLELAADIAVAMVKRYVAQHANLEAIVFSCFDQTTAAVYQSKI